MIKGADVGPVPAGTLTPTPAPSAKAIAPAPRVARSFDSCAALTAVYPHGVGMPDAVDEIGHFRKAKRPGALPSVDRDNPGESVVKVADFGRSTALYGANRPLDVDQDGIACER